MDFPIRFCFAIFAWLSPAVIAAAAEQPPNVVMLIGDDQAWTDFGFMGHEVVRTPNLDKLAAAGAVFPRAYVPTSLCRPSLATMISGLYPHQHGITGNDPLRGIDRSVMLKHIQQAPSLPRLLGAKGYASHQSGKWWEGSPSLGGFTAGMTHGDPARGGRHGDEGLKIGREGLKPVFDFVDGRDGKPFFLWYAPFLPHQPHNPPARILDKYKSPDRPLALSKYYAMCEWFDETCGQLLDGLEQRGLIENSLVLFVTDNGWIQRTAETKLPPGWNRPFAPRSKLSPYDGGIRCPILIKWPGHVTPGRYDSLVSSIDLAPTVLAAVGIEKPAEMPGIDLISLAAAGGQTKRESVFGEIFSHDVADIDRPAASLQYRWIVSDTWKLIVPADSDLPPELYDIVADPHEMRDFSNEKKDVVRSLSANLDRWWPGK